MPFISPNLLGEAVTWLVRTREPGFADWEAFASWLEVDPQRNDAYEAAFDAHDATGGLIAPAETPADREVAVSEPGRSWRARRRWAGVAAAALVAAVVSPSLLPRHQRFVVATAPGKQRSLRLADGTVIAMNGDTRLVMDRAAIRAVRLEAGEASFTVVHDAAHPFVVTAGSTRIEDIGTVFDVVRSADATDVAVASGSVLYDPDAAAMKLTSGQTVHDPDRGMTEIGDADPAAIGSWRVGRLVYRDAPLGIVARDLARTIGEPVRVAPEIGSRRFSGTIVVRGVERRHLFARLSTLLNVAVTHDAGGWRLARERGAAG